MARNRQTGDDLAEHGLGLARDLEQLASGRFTNVDNRRLVKHISKHVRQWFWFLIDPTIDATNYRAEQAIRPAVIGRKTWGGNRTQNGAKSQSILTSLFQTCEQRGQDTFQFLVDLIRSPIPLIIPA